MSKARVPGEPGPAGGRRGGTRRAAGGPTVTVTREMTQDSHVENMARLRDFVEDACRQAGVDEDTVFAFKLAVDEACTNIVMHGYAGRAPGPITVTCACAPQQVVVTITDFGRSFDPAALRPADRSSDWMDRPIGGLGLFLIQELMDEVRYQAGAPGGNRLTLVKQRAPGAAPGTPRA
ncbi:MAG TPA: ATP-binding protein [Chloroflexia bacterium]|nr:ATP-binding protein [Chloroflexia bacterium]